MSEGYREDIDQNVATRMGWTRWWSKEEWAKIVPGGRNMLRAIRVLLGGIGLWVRPVVEALAFPGPDWVAYVAFILVKVYVLPLVVCALLVSFVWLARKLWLAWQQRL